MSGGGSVGPSASELELSKIALKQWNDFAKPIISKTAPVQAGIALNPNYRRQAELGNVNATTTQAFDRANSHGRDVLQSRGVDPTSGKFVNALMTGGISKGLALGSNLAGADQRLKNKSLARQSTAAFNNLGLQGVSMGGLSSAASTSLNQAIAEQQARDAEASAYGNLAGAGIRYVAGQMSGGSGVPKGGGGFTPAAGVATQPRYFDAPKGGW